MSVLTRWAANSPFYLPPSDGGTTRRVGYLLAPGATAPDTLTVREALYDVAGTFLLFTPVDESALGAFVTAAQQFLANRARAGAAVAWVDVPDGSAPVLSGTVLFATRGAGSAVVARTMLLEFANVAIGIAAGATIAPSSDGDGLAFAAGPTPNALYVTPFGSRTAVTLPMTTDARLPLLAPGAARGCLAFGLTMNAAAADALDVGLRAYTAPIGGGYAEAARLPVFDLSATSAPLAATIDPLRPLDPARTRFAFATPDVALASHYRSPVGGRYTLTPGAGGALLFGARLTGVDANGNAVDRPGGPLTLAPAGAFALAAAPGVATGNLSATLMTGLSAVEYFTVADGATLTFVPGQPAFAPTLADAGSDGTGRVFGPLAGAGTTSWSVLGVPGGTSYYAQPDSAVLYQPPKGTSLFLDYLPLKLGTLTSGGEHAGYPLLPYAGAPALTGLSADDVAQFELQVWAPARRGAVRGLMSGSVHATADAGASLPPFGTSAQGLLIDFTGDQWTTLTVGVSPPPDNTAPPDQRQRRQQLLLQGVTGDLQEALQTNQLFLVATAADLFQRFASVPYTLTAERLALLAAMGEDADVVARLKKAFVPPVQWNDSAALDAALQPVLTPAQYQAEQTTPLIHRATGDFSLFVAGWEFDLSPWRWADHKSIVIFKFCRKSLAQLALDTTQWASPASFNAVPGAVQQQMAAFFDDAVKRYDGGKGDTDFAWFVNTVLSDPAWNGILVLDATVPLSGLPAQMEGLAAGIDASRFRAHHVGINVTPVQSPPDGSKAVAQPSSAFALIDYEDKAPLVSTDDYQFKVDTLKVLIANSQIASFSSRIELLVNRLFGEPVQQVTGTTGNALPLSGYYQKSGGVGSYRFVTDQATSYRVTSAVLYKVAIASASFVTVTDPDPNDTTCHAYFGLTGAVSFLPQPGFDAWSYGPEAPAIAAGTGDGGLHYAGLAIDMTFDVATPTYKTFAFDLSRIALDPSQSAVRAASLAAHFPMKLTGLTQGLGSATPDTLGFMPVDSPLTGSELAAPWYALRFDLDLGSPGALAADVGFTAGLLLGWAPSAGTTPVVYVGLGLPGVSGGNRAISLEGVLSLTFGDLLFVAQPPTYMLQLGNIALKLFMLTFPPNGQVNLLLFGNPDAQTSGALGWYASYVKNGAGGGSGAARLAKTNAGLLAVRS